VARARLSRRLSKTNAADCEIVLSRLDTSHEELAAARQLLESGFPRQATSRAFYAAFYAAHAALEVAGIAPPKTHTGLRTKFSEFATQPRR
jgi:uncharacterized protein (UPF0332 family)